MVIISSFCGLLSLQVGLVVLSAVYFTLAIAMILINFFHFIVHHDGFLYFILIIISAGMLILIGTSMFMTSFAESIILSRVTVMLLLVHFLYWLILSAIAFNGNDQHLKLVCARRVRCAESLWIVDLEYRVNRLLMYTTEKPISENSSLSYVLNIPGSQNNTNRSKRHKNNVLNFNTNYPNNEPFEDFRENYDSLFINTRKGPEVVTYIISGFRLLGAIILFISTITFFIYSAVVTWCYGSELKEVDVLGDAELIKVGPAIHVMT